MKVRPMALPLALALCAAVIAPASAQNSEGIYFRSGNWDVKRSQWSAFAEAFEKNTKPTLEKLFEQGAITEWGFDANSVHTADGYTHSTWWAAKDLASLERVLDTLDEEREKLSEKDRAAQPADMERRINKHSDTIGRSVVIRTRPTRLDAGYFMSSSVRAKPGEGQTYQKLWETYAQPTYEKLFKDGAIVSYGMDVAYIHSDKPGTRTAWYVVPDMSGEDKVNAAFDEAREKRSEVERAAISKAFRDVTEPDSHRDSMSRIIHYAVK